MLILISSCHQLKEQTFRSIKYKLELQLVTRANSPRPYPMNSWLSNTSHWLKKQYFNSTHYLDKWANQGDKLSEGDICIFGIKFDKDKKQQAFQLYQSVLWFTYRDNINFEGFPNIRSDVGWGCMLRVGQMMLAQALRILKGPTYYSDEKWLNVLIGEFIGENGQFSIENLVKIGHQLLQKQPGQWYSSYDIAAVLQRAIQNKQLKSKQSPKQLPFSLSTIITTGQFSLESVYKQTKIALKQSPSIHKIKPCLLIIICRLGFQKPEQELLWHLLQIMRHQKNCVGVLGGRPSKAHYIFGTTQKSFIYLDPHCVKDQLNIQSFLCQNIFSMPHEKIDPSMGICFLFPTFKEMILTHERLRNMKCNPLIYCHEFEKFEEMGIELEGEETEEIYQILD